MAFVQLCSGLRASLATRLAALVSLCIYTKGVALSVIHIKGRAEEQQRGAKNLDSVERPIIRFIRI